MGFLFSVLLPYLAVCVFLVGMILRVAIWLRAPVPFHLTLFPAPENTMARLVTVSVEFFLFRTLFRENRFLWIWVWLFHLALLMVVTGHALGIYFLRNQFTLVGVGIETSRLLSSVLGGVAGGIMTASLVALLCLRVFKREVRRLSGPDAYFDLLLLLAIAGTGILMYIPGFHADLPAVRAYVGGLCTLHPQPFPKSTAFVLHFGFVNLLLLYLPFSRLMHSAGFFVIRAMLVEAPPVYPTPAGKPLRSAFAERRRLPGSKTETRGREVSKT